MDAIYIGSDHRGFELKRSLSSFLKGLGYNVVDEGPSSYDPDDDYPDYAEKVCKKVLSSKTNAKGILICGGGNGMARAANKIHGIYAALCSSEESAKYAMMDGDTNVLCLSAMLTTPDDANKIAKAWLTTPFSGHERHVRRIKKVKDIEHRHMKPVFHKPEA